MPALGWRGDNDFLRTGLEVLSGTGAIIEFTRGNEEPLELLINNKVIGVGEAVKVGENFGLKITQIGDVKQLIRSMGGESR